MVQINMATKEITMKVVYYGPALSGKTTNLQQLHLLMNPQSRSEMVTLDTRDDRTLYFDFLPIEFEAAGGFSVKMKVFTVPGQVMHKSTRKVVLAGADAICFVADSQRSSASANAYSWRDMEANLKQNGIDFERLPPRADPRALPQPEREARLLGQVRGLGGRLPERRPAQVPGKRAPRLVAARISPARACIYPGLLRIWARRGRRRQFDTGVHH